jgi:2-octaprenyl-6-methoxyphenol hydroxylase
VKTDTFDVVISGGGLSGCLMALSLADLHHADGTPLSIAIVEASPILKNHNLTFDDRVLALSHGSADYLEKVGAWQGLKNDVQAIETIHISDREHYGKARIYAKEYDVSALGYVIGMALVGKSLLTVLANKNKIFNNVSWFAPDNITSVNWQEESVNIMLSSGQSLFANLLIGCDGANSICRKLANIKMTETCYGQSALITNVATVNAHNNIAYERFTDTGPIAMLPLSTIKEGEHRCSLVWTLTPELADEMLSLNDDEFKQTLESNFGSWLGGITQVGKRHVYPLKLVQAQEQVYHRTVLLGNAAHTIHPIAGQGFNLGLRDVQQLTAVIKMALDQQQDIGLFSLLSAYAQQREKDHQQVISLTDSLVTLFSNQLAPMVAGRNIGLKMLNYLSPIKADLVKKTMGY